MASPGNRHGRALGPTAFTDVDIDAERHHGTHLPWTKVSPTLASSVQNGLFIGDDLDGEAKRIKDTTERQFPIAKKYLLCRDGLGSGSRLSRSLFKKFVRQRFPFPASGGGSENFHLLHAND